LALFLNLLVGHLLGDFLLQPGSLVLRKRERAWALLLHAVLVGLVTALVLAGQLDEYWMAVILVVAAHLAIELLTIAAYRATRTRGLFTFTFDQTLHFLSLGLIVWLVGAWRIDETAVSFGVEMPIGTLAAIAGLLMVTLFGSILVFETVNAALKADEGKGRILRWDLPRVGGVIERGSALVLALLWSPLLLAAPFLPRLIVALRSPPDERARQALTLVSGLVLCVLVYAGIMAIVVVAEAGS
jgi:hypothetical protein